MGATGERAYFDIATVAQASKPAGPQVSKLAGLESMEAWPTWKSATQQV
jgi:hypothetical protein